MRDLHMHLDQERTSREEPENSQDETDGDEEPHEGKTDAEPLVLHLVRLIGYPSGHKCEPQ